jgi:hypothetical protein
VERIELTASGNRQAAGSEQFSQLSNLSSSGSFIEDYGGGTDDADATKLFDPLEQRGGRHYIPGLGISINRRGNHPYASGSIATAGFSPSLVTLNDSPHSAGFPSGSSSCKGSCGGSSSASMMGAVGLTSSGMADMRCTPCECPNKPGLMGCFYPSELSSLPPGTVCLIDLKDCHTCTRCDGFQGQAGNSEIDWTAGDISSVHFNRYGTGISIGTGGSVRGYPPGPSEINDDCWQRAYEESGIASCVQGIEDVFRVYGEHGKIKDIQGFINAIISIFNNRHGEGGWNLGGNLLNWIIEQILSHVVGSNTDALKQLLENICWQLGLPEFCERYYQCVLEYLPEGDPFLEKRIECCKNLNQRLDPTTNWKVPNAWDEIRNGLAGCGGDVEMVVTIFPDDGGGPTPVIPL